MVQLTVPFIRYDIIYNKTKKLKKKITKKKLPI